ncbi:MAG TPA: efflux transporter outer membrane subunit [Tepidisphaeraceae bacterium]|jgi:NodT family efflux transporter outer membrane factor (OMF) lipoprotein|nr:efflux transporter outer membrane subunit [Tepidisphaeraceae bacterium]
MNFYLARCCRSLFLLVFLTTGCMVGPDFHPVSYSTPARFVNPGAPSIQPTTRSSLTVSDPVQVIQWWRTFNDPTLDSLIDRAVVDNYDLRQATSRLREARAQVGLAASALYPQVNGDASYTRSGTGSGGVVTTTGRKGAIVAHTTSTRSDFYVAGFDAAWELDVFGGLRRGVESADASLAAAVEDRRDVMVTLLAEVATDYVALRQFQREVDIARENLASDEHIEALTREKFGAGFAANLDVANAAAEVATTKAAIPILQTEAQQEIYSLSILLGEEPGALMQELSKSKPIPLTPPRVPIGLPSDLLRRRPDIRAAEADYHAATANVGVAVADLFPKFSLTGNLDDEGTRLKALGNWSSNVWQFGPSVSLPIFTGGQIRSNIEVQNALQQQALYTYDQIVLTALQDVDNALIAYANDQARRDALVDSVKYNRQALDLSTRLYNTGLGEFLNVLTAEQSLFSSEDALAQSQGTVATDLAALYKALGGGWQIDPTSPAFASAATQPAEELNHRDTEAQR